MFFGDPQSGVNEMVRVLKPNRKLVLAAWAEPSKNPWATTASSAINDLLNIAPPAADGPGLFRQSATGILAEMMNTAGLTGVKQAEINGKWVFDSRQQYWDFMTDVVAPVAVPLRAASPAEHDRAKQAVFTACADYSDAGKVVFNWSCWIAAGLKM